MKISGPVHRWPSASNTSCAPRSDARRDLKEPGGWAKVGQRFAQPAGLRSLTLANQTGRVKNPCVRHAWSIGERELKGVPDRGALPW